MRILFVGPSLHGDLDRVRVRFPDVEIRGPAARGDVMDAVRDGAHAIGLVDGRFGDVLSVWHKELLFALEEGVAVGGGGSLGALRAAECSAFGMVGIGTIWRDYATGRLMDDEAVGLVHGPAELGWPPLSVPWVDYAATVERLAAVGAIDEGERNLLTLAGRQMHFSERTFDAVLRLCPGLGENRRRTILALLKSRRVERKRSDAWRVVRWLATARAGDAPRSWTLARTTQWKRLAGEHLGLVSPAPSRTPAGKTAPA